MHELRMSAIRKALTQMSPEIGQASALLYIHQSFSRTSIKIRKYISFGKHGPLELSLAIYM